MTWLRAGFVFGQLLAVSGSLWGTRVAVADDWPTFRHDLGRSGTTTEQVAADRLELAWCNSAKRPPRPAWDGPARWDAYVKRTTLGNMRDYDAAFHTVVVGDAAYFGSSVDDAVHCVSAIDGKPRWRFTTGGPVRVPPMFADGRVYFGSDDGYAYCIDAVTGRLIWKFSPTINRRKVFNDGRLISQWPVRTGVAVRDGTAYFAASLFPWQKSYLCAVDAESGRSDCAGCFVAEHEKLGLEGSMIAGQHQIIATQGRTSPYLFNRADGASLGQLGGVGGSFALLAPNERIYVGPGPKEGRISETNPQAKESVVKCGGLAMAVGGDVAYVLERGVVAALRLSDSNWVWRNKEDYPYAIVLAGDTVLVGGDNSVAAFVAADGTKLWEQTVKGRAHGLAVARGSLFISTDLGHIYCYREADDPGGEVRPLVSTQPPPSEPVEPIDPKLANVPDTIAFGPILDFTDPSTARIRWETYEPTKTRVNYGLGDRTQSIEEEESTTHHEARLTGLLPRRVYSYELVSDQDGQTIAGPFECDTHFNYNAENIDQSTPTQFVEEVPQAINANVLEQLLAKSGSSPGIGIVISPDVGRLAWDVARQTQLHVIGFDSDSEKVQQARVRLQSTDQYGPRINIQQAEAMSSLPLPDRGVNLAIVEISETDQFDESKVAEIERILHPNGTAIFFARGLDSADATFAAMNNAMAKRGAEPLIADAKSLWIIRGKPVVGVGEWSHQYGRADNATYGGETLGGANTTEEFAVQWFGRPGPRYQSDRENRKPAPLSTGGRLYLQGLERVIALDAYNGTILWNLEIPGCGRFNMREDSANWCADTDHVFLAVRDSCWQLDAGTGQVVTVHRAGGDANQESNNEWGYVGRAGSMLVGSSRRAGAAYRDFWGGQFWYEATAGPLAAKVCSRSLFGIDVATAARRWTYENGTIIDTTITMTSDRVYFVESRNSKLNELDSDRVEDAGLWEDQFLVAINLSTGKVEWEVAIDTDDGVTMFSMAHSGATLAIVSSMQKQFHVVTFDAGDGRQIWEQHLPWASDGKGAHSSRPVIVGNRLYVRPATFDFLTGERLDIEWPGATCGTFAAAKDVMLFRSGNVAMWSPDSETLTSWERLRPDCWLSTIPAAGMVLSPEGGGGCSCGGWLETSIGFLPRHDFLPQHHESP